MKLSYESPELEEAKFGTFIAGESNGDFEDDFGNEDDPDNG